MSTPAGTARSGPHASDGRRVTEMPPFDGAPEVVRMLGDLVDRGQRLPRRSTVIRGLPMVCLVQPVRHPALLAALAERLRDAQPHQVPFAYVDLAEAGEVDAEAVVMNPDEVPPTNQMRRVENVLQRLRDESADAVLTDQDRDDLRGVMRAVSVLESAPMTEAHVHQVRDILQEVAERLADPRNAGQGALRFPRLELVQWLMRLDLSEKPRPRRIEQLRAEIRHRSFNRRIRDTLGTMVGEVDLASQPWWVLAWNAVTRGLPAAWFALRSSGRVPVLSGEYRWMLRQPYLAAERSGTFLRFAHRLTFGEWQQEQPEHLAKFLVNAFLEDLRQTFRRYPYRPSAARRTAYPVVLLDNIRRNNCGYLLLKLVNDVRNDIGQLDPLVVVSSSQKVPPDADEPGSTQQGRVFDADRAANALEHWRRRLDPQLRRRGKLAWYLPIQVPAGPDSASAEAEKSRVRQDLDVQRYVVRPPSWASKVRPWMAAVLLLVVATVGYALWSREHCWQPMTGFSPTYSRVGDECVGFTDGSVNLFQPSDGRIGGVVDRILEQNGRAEDMHRAFPQRELVTIVHMGALTSSSGHTGGLASQREALEGVAVAQDLQLAKGDSAAPLVKILIANGGKEMLQGAQVARMLGDAAESDDSIVGVIGLDQSSKPTVRTVEALTEAGLPMVAGALSADGLADNHPMFYQVAPQNRRQAEVAAGFAQQLRKTGAPGVAPPSNSVRIVHAADPNDSYSANLRADVESAMRARGFETTPVPFTTQNAQATGQQMCGFDGLVYYAGRGVPEFDAFLTGVSRTCGNAPPLILAGDDVSRFVADPAMRQRNSAVPFYFQTFAVAPTTGDPAREELLLSSERSFYNNLNRLFPEEGEEGGSSLDGHAALAHDAALTMITAVQYVSDEGIPVTPGAVWREISDIRTAGRHLVGATGVIDFGGDVANRVPVNKPVSILRVEDGEVDPEVAGFCAGPPNEQRPRQIQHPCPPVQ